MLAKKAEKNRNFCLPKKHLRVTSREVSKVFDKPVRYFSKNFTLLVRDNDCGYPRIVSIVAKKSVSAAVARNGIKRKLKESFRKNKHKIGGSDLVFVFKRGKSKTKKMAKLEKKQVSFCEIESIWEKLVC